VKENMYIFGAKIKKFKFKFCLKNTFLTHAYEVQHFVVSDLL
jgi:hypothetical protein